MMRHLLVIGAVVASAGVSAAMQARPVQQAPSRDARMAAMGSAEISGVVMTDETTPQPVRRAMVRAIPAGGGAPSTAYTDAAGRFIFSSLPTGRYTVEAFKPGFVRTAYGARRPDRPGTPVTLSETERTQTENLRMPRGGVITGRVLDEFGQPAQGARVRAQQVRTINGERTLSEVMQAGALLGEPTDDRGVYRLYGLPAGDYVISATPRNSGWGDIRQLSEADITAAERAVEQTDPAPAPASEPVFLGYTAIYYPGVVNAAQAGAVALKAGEERMGVDFSVHFVRTATVAGTVAIPAGVPPGSVEWLMLPRRTGGGNGSMMLTFSTSNRRVGADGQFSFTGITPGAYTLSAQVNQENGTSLWAHADIDVDGQNLAGLSLALQEGLNVSGRMAFEMDGVDPPTLFSRASLNLVPAEGSQRITIGVNRPVITDSGGFTIRGVTPGRYRAAATFNTPEVNWTLKSAIIKGVDALDVPFDLLPGDSISDAVFTFTNRTQELSGTLQDESKRPAPDYTVVVFPADKALWTSGRRIRSTRPGTDGKFTFANLPAGAYRIAAITDIGPEELRDQALLEELAAASIPVTLADGEKKTQDLRLASGGR
jgi:protocatechuate 3,4-dioxygenase beta subunit